MVVQHIDDDGQFEDALRKAGATKLVVCDFFAHWCGPCRFIAPIFEQLSNKYNEVVFLKIDVDKCRMAAQLYSIRAMPTFVVLLNRRELSRIAGADSNALERMIAANVQSGSSAKLKENVSPYAAFAEERIWLEKIVATADKMKDYEDEVAQTLALSLLPADELRAKSTIDGIVNQYEMAKNLMNWFHDQFFEWVDKMPCDKCFSKNSTYVRNDAPTPSERADGAGHVELFSCGACGSEIRFPRYRNATKLLETRRGRCGEWADCFVLFCRSVGFDTRWVNNNLDHVWVEIWSDELDRWVHLDPCENVIDTPLMYEKGWGRKHAYVFAFGTDHVRDVTWRYCFNHKAAVERRKTCREPVLRNFLNKLNARLAKNLPKKRQQFLLNIYIKELAEFLSPQLQLRDGSESEHHGRVSGSEKWRQQRGELGTCDASTTSGRVQQAQTVEKFVIKPTENELAAKCLTLTYNCANDEYSRPNDNETKARGWRSLCHEAEGVFRKFEPDWKMAYLCRKENAQTGFITWKIDLSGTRAKCAEINLGALTTFKSGGLMATACCGDSCAMIPENTGSTTFDEIAGSEYLEIRVDFSGGEGDCAWQHAQLFRTSCNEPCENMILRVYFS